MIQCISQELLSDGFCDLGLIYAITEQTSWHHIKDKRHLNSEFLCHFGKELKNLIRKLVIRLVNIDYIKET